MLRSPVYTGTASSERTRPVPARIRQSALRPVGPGHSQRPAPPEEWIAIPVPAIINPETCAAAQARLARTPQRARRHNTTHDDWLRGMVSCGPCQLAWTGRTLPPGDHDDLCRGRTEALRAARGERCTARFAPARALDEWVWQDLCRILREPALMMPARARAHGGEWLPQALQARRKTLREALTQLERQHARRLDVYVAESIGRDEFERTRQEVTHTQHGLTQPLRPLEAQAQPQVDTAALAQGLEAFCRRLQPTLDQLTCAQRRPLVERLIDHVIVTHDQVAIRSVAPTGPKGETTPCCHVRLDYLYQPPQCLPRHTLSGPPGQISGDHRALVRFRRIREGHDHTLLMVGLDLEPGTTDQDADDFVSTDPALLKHTWRWRNIRFETDARVAKPHMLILGPWTDHRWAAERRGLLPAWVRRLQRLGKPQRDRKGTRLASELCTPLKRQRVWGGVGGIPGGFGRTVVGGTPGLFTFSSACCHAVRGGSGRYHAKPTGRVTCGVTSHHTTRGCPVIVPTPGRVLALMGFEDARGDLAARVVRVLYHTRALGERRWPQHHRDARLPHVRPGPLGLAQDPGACGSRVGPQTRPCKLRPAPRLGDEKARQTTREPASLPP